MTKLGVIITGERAQPGNPISESVAKSEQDERRREREEAEEEAEEEVVKRFLPPLPSPPLVVAAAAVTAMLARSLSRSLCISRLGMASCLPSAWLVLGQSEILILLDAFATIGRRVTHALASPALRSS